MRYRRLFSLIVSTTAMAFLCSCAPPSLASSPSPLSGKEAPVKLPEPQHEGKVSIEETLFERRSVRGYKNEPLTLAEVSQLLWAAQGITESGGLRTAPSAGALYPLEVYLVAGNVSSLSSGIYKYVPDGHQLIRMSDGDVRGELARAALSQTFIADAPASFIFTAVYERTTRKYGERGVRYVHVEVGHAAENLLLQGVALGIGAVTVGAFADDQVARLMKLPAGEEPLYIIAAGRK